MIDFESFIDLIADNFFGVINIERDVNIIGIFMFFCLFLFLLYFNKSFRLLFLWFDIHMRLINYKLK